VGLKSLRQPPWSSREINDEVGVFTTQEICPVGQLNLGFGRYGRDHKALHDSSNMAPSKCSHDSAAVCAAIQPPVSSRSLLQV
jgi:hypothetical protein